MEGSKSNKQDQQLFLKEKIEERKSDLSQRKNHRKGYITNRIVIWKEQNQELDVES